MQEHLFWTFYYREHGGFLSGVSIAIINKTDSSTLLKRENYCETRLSELLLNSVETFAANLIHIAENI